MNGADAQTLDALQRSVAQLAGSTCADCPRLLCGHDAVFSIALGFKDRPRCLACLARGLGRAADELLDELRAYIRARDCYRTAWEQTSERERVDSEHPACIALALSAPAPETTSANATAPAAAHEPAGDWDAGALACGDLVLALRGRLRALPPGAVLRVIARDPAAPADLPAWCRLTGNRLVGGQHPEYLIQRKGD